MSLYVAAYDIGSDGRRARVAHLLAEYGQRVQQSVFELWLTPRQLRALRRRVGPLLDPRDKFQLFPVDERGPRRRVAWQTPPNPYAPVIVVRPRDERERRVPGCRVFPVDDLKQEKPWNWLYRRIHYLPVGESLPPEDLPWTLADRDETWIGAVSAADAIAEAPVPEVRDASPEPGGPGKESRS